MKPSDSSEPVDKSCAPEGVTSWRYVMVCVTKDDTPSPTTDFLGISVWMSLLLVTIHPHSDRLDTLEKIPGLDISIGQVFL